MNKILYTLNQAKQTNKYNYNLFQDSIQMILADKSENKINKDLLIDSIEKMIYVTEEQIINHYNELQTLKQSIDDDLEDEYMTNEQMQDRIIEIEDEIINMHTIIDTLREL